MKSLRALGRLPLLLFSAAIAAGCAELAAGVTKGVLDKVFETTPPELEATLEASKKLNPDAHDRPSPLVVRLYELTDLTEFNAAEFYSLYENDKDLLAKAIRGRHEMMLLPGEQKEFKREFNMETRYLGVMAAYRDLEKAVWRASVETPVDETTYVRITFGPNSVAIEPIED